MLAGWASPVVTHYTRLAPLRAITSDFKRSLQEQADRTKKDREKVNMTRSMKALELQLPRANAAASRTCAGVRRFGKHSWRSTGAVWLTGVIMIEGLRGIRMQLPRGPARH